MASSEAAVIDVEGTSHMSSSAQLKFQDFRDDDQQENPSQGGETHMFTNFPDSVDDDTEHSDLLGEEKKTPSVWNFEFYQSFFNVDTGDVLRRIVWSMIPKPGYNFLQYHVRPNPDLYGPFWISTTLIFTIAIMGNLANYLRTANQGEYIWQYDFHKVTLAAAAIYSYASLIPLLLWVFLWYRRSEAGCTFLEILCIYGYSLSIYIPVSILWVIQLNWLQWTLVLVGSVMSGMVLLVTFWPALKNDNKKFAVAAMAVIIILHVLLAVGFLLYFFYVPDIETKSEDVVVRPSISSATVVPTAAHVDKIVNSTLKLLTPSSASVAIATVSS